MKVLGLGMPELVVILIVVLLIFGPKNLPKLGAAIGKGVRSLREGIGGDKDEQPAEEPADAVVEKIEAAEEPEVVEPASEPKKVKRVVKKVTTTDKTESE